MSWIFFYSIGYILHLEAYLFIASIHKTCDFFFTHYYESYERQNLTEEYYIAPVVYIKSCGFIVLIIRNYVLKT